MGLRNQAEQFISERIQELMDNRLEEDMTEKKRCTDQADQIFQRLDPEIREQVESLLTLFIDLRADEERFLYLSGIRDGIGIAGLLQEWKLTD